VIGLLLWIGGEGRIYLMAVEDKLLFAKYFFDPGYKYKIAKWSKRAAAIGTSSQKRSCESFFG
jgi:hypothetical protein